MIAAEAPRAARGVALLALVPLLPLLAFRDPLLPVDDGLDHLGSIRKRVETGAVFPASAFYATSRGEGADARKGLFHGAVALVSQATRTPAIEVWNALPFASSYWAILAVYGAGWVLFRDPLVAALSAAVFAVTVDGGLAGGWLTRFGHAGRAVTGAYWSAWALLLDGTLRPPAALLALIGFGMAAIHPFAPMQVAISATLLMGFAALLGKDDLRERVRGAVDGAGWVVGGAAPYLGYRLLTGPAVRDAIHTEPQGLFYWTNILFTMNPAWLLGGWGLAGVISVPLALLVVGRARREEAFAFVASGVLGTAAILANPLATPVLHRSIGYLVTRLTWFTPHPFLIAERIAAAGRRLFGRALARPAVSSRAAAAVFLALGGCFFAFAPSGAAKGDARSDFAGGFDAQRGAFTAVDEAIARPSVILSDPATGYAIPALTKHWTVSASAQHTPPSDPDARERLRDTRRVLSPYVDARETVDLLRKYGAEYVLLNDSPEPARLRYLSYAGADAFPASRAKFDREPALFETALETGGLLLYKLTPRALDGPLPAAGSALRPLPFTSARDGEPVPGEPAFRFLGGEVLSAEAKPGGVLTLKTRWARDADVAERNRYVIVRIDRRGDAGPLPGTPFAKIARRLRDRLRGETTRTRIGYAPGSGFLPPNDWPLGRPIEDVSELPLPADLAPGDYDVKVRLIEEAFYPNLRPADLFSYRDSYDGTSVGGLHVGG